MLKFYRELIALRKKNPLLAKCPKSGIKTFVKEEQGILSIMRENSGKSSLLVINFDGKPQSLLLQTIQGIWGSVFDSNEEQWLGTGDLAEKSHKITEMFF